MISEHITIWPISEVMYKGKLTNLDYVKGPGDSGPSLWLVSPLLLSNYPQSSCYTWKNLVLISQFCCQSTLSGQIIMCSEIIIIWPFSVYWVEFLGDHFFGYWLCISSHLIEKK